MLIQCYNCFADISDKSNYNFMYNEIKEYNQPDIGGIKKERLGL